MLGYADWATYQAETRMAGSPDTIRTFLERVDAALAPARTRLSGEYLARLRNDDPSIAELRTWDLPHAAELVRRERYALDGREVRSYFPFAVVKQGLIELAAELFGLQFVRAAVPVWHPDVEAYEAREDGELIGRIYLDLHPRPGKFTHYAVAGVRAGVAGRQLPEAVLVANFPGGQPGDPGPRPVCGRRRVGRPGRLPADGPRRLHVARRDAVRECAEARSRDEYRARRDRELPKKPQVLQLHPALV